MSKRALVFGSSGQLGVELVRELNARGYAVHGFERKAIDISDRDLVEKCVADDLIIAGRASSRCGRGAARTSPTTWASASVQRYW